MDIQPIASLVQLGKTALTDQAATAAGTAVPAPASAAPPATAASATLAPAASAEPTPTQLAEAIKSINKTMSALAPGLEFSVDKDTHSFVVKVVDLQTKEVIRQMPTKEALEIAKALDQVRGLLIREKV